MKNNSIETLRKYTLKDKFNPEDTFYKQSDVLKAMQDYAKEESICFGLHLENMPTIKKFTVHPPYGSCNSTGLYEKTIEQLYNEYKQL